MDKNTLTVLVPVFNEQESIIPLLTKLRNQEIPNLKVVVINDGSIDKTRDLLEENSDLWDECIHFGENKGKGHAIKTGLSYVSSEYVLIQDADLEYDPEEIPRLWGVVSKYHVDLLMTSRLNGMGLTRVHYFWHRFGNKLITLIFNICFNTTFTDIYSGYLIFRRSLVETDKLIVNGWGQQAEIISTIVKKRGLVYETPISYFGRTYHEGKKIRAFAIFGVIATIIFRRFR
jgi:glycosyltransferase involved in cell wall biosynthesis